MHERGLAPSEQEDILRLSHPNSRPSQKPPCRTPTIQAAIRAQQRETEWRDQRQPTYMSLCCLSPDELSSKGQHPKSQNILLWTQGTTLPANPLS